MTLLGDIPGARLISCYPWCHISWQACGRRTTYFMTLLGDIAVTYPGGATLRALQGGNILVGALYVACAAFCDVAVSDFEAGAIFLVHCILDVLGLF